MLESLFGDCQLPLCRNTVCLLAGVMETNKRNTSRKGEAEEGRVEKNRRMWFTEKNSVSFSNSQFHNSNPKFETDLSLKNSLQLKQQIMQ